uniref:Uncharacterized protein n=1 Tax=Knipowitschia caucasica TaxID=637954 RepID=A0AAV2KSV0_KNICA
MEWLGPARVNPINHRERVISALTLPLLRVPTFCTIPGDTKVITGTLRTGMWSGGVGVT